ncbi:unnamed protein product [Closterium sp. NIES-54]
MPTRSPCPPVLPLLPPLLRCWRKKDHPSARRKGPGVRDSALVCSGWWRGDWLCAMRGFECNRRREEPTKGGVAAGMPSDNGKQINPLVCIKAMSNDALEAATGTTEANTGERGEEGGGWPQLPLLLTPTSPPPINQPPLTSPPISTAPGTTLPPPFSSSRPLPTHDGPCTVLHRWGCWSWVGLLVTGGAAGHRWGCRSQVGLLVTGGAAGHRWGCWSEVGLLVTGGAAGHRWGCWSQVGLLVTGGLLVLDGAAGHRWGCWSQVGLLVTGGAAGHSAWCWRDGAGAGAGASDWLRCCWCWCWRLALVLVPGAGVTALELVLVLAASAGAGAWCWRLALELVPGAGGWRWCWCLVLAAGAGGWRWCWWLVLAAGDGAGAGTWCWRLALELVLVLAAGAGAGAGAWWLLRLVRVAFSHTRLSSRTTVLVTPPCRACAACTLVSLSMASLGLCPRSRARLHCRAFPASRGGSAPLFTPHFL